MQTWALWLVWIYRETTSLTNERKTTCGLPCGCLIQLSFTCREIFDEKWRSHLKLLGASDKQNVFIWTEIQLTYLTTNTRGSLKTRCSIWGQCLWLQRPLLPTVDRTPYTESQHYLIWLPRLLASTEEAKFTLTEQLRQASKYFRLNEFWFFQN